MRLDKAVTAAGLSRSEARAAIAQGRVAINAQPILNAAAQIPPGAYLTLDGAPIAPATHLHLMLNKPAGVVTAATDHRARTVFDLLPAPFRRHDLCAVGRLDRDTTGLLLFTTDGQLAHRLIAPRFSVEKQYRATLNGTLTDAHVRRMADGIALKDFTARPARLTIVAPNVGELIVTEGKYHQVKRMFGAMGLTVTALTRLSVGGVPLDPALAPGEARPLTPDETSALYRITRLEQP